MRQGAAFWVTGLPGSGKSTLARAAKDALPGIVVLSMDEMRGIVTPHPTYGGEERDHLYMGLVFAAVVLCREGCDVVIDATANLRKWRDDARRLIPNFHEIYVRCPLDTCREREKYRIDPFAPKDIYRKAEAGAPVPGVNVPYEEPLTPELVIDCAFAPDKSSSMLSDYINSVVTP